MEGIAETPQEAAGVSSTGADTAEEAVSPCSRLDRPCPFKSRGLLPRLLEPAGAGLEERLPLSVSPEPLVFPAVPKSKTAWGVRFAKPPLGPAGPRFRRWWSRSAGGCWRFRLLLRPPSSRRLLFLHLHEGNLKRGWHLLGACMSHASGCRVRGGAGGRLALAGQLSVCVRAADGQEKCPRRQPGLPQNLQRVYVLRANTQTRVGTGSCVSRERKQKDCTRLSACLRTLSPRGRQKQKHHGSCSCWQCRAVG